MKKPIIGITSITTYNERMHSQRVTYPEAIWKSGGEAILLPTNPDKSNCNQLVSMLDGLLVPGGPDIDPALYGEEVLEQCGRFQRYEDEYDMELVKEAVKQGKPILCICRGMQLTNVLYGGSLYQDLPTQYSDEMRHTRNEDKTENYHTATLEPDSYLAKVLGEWENVRVNTSHHQAVKDVGEGFRVVGRAPDGTVEAIENEDASILCVQWHPERMMDMEIYQKLFKDFIERCRLK